MDQEHLLLHQVRLQMSLIARAAALSDLYLSVCQSAEEPGQVRLRAGGERGGPGAMSAGPGCKVSSMSPMKLSYTVMSCRRNSILLVDVAGSSEVSQRLAS